MLLVVVGWSPEACADIGSVRIPFFAPHGLVRTQQTRPSHPSSQQQYIRNTGQEVYRISSRLAQSVERQTLIQGFPSFVRYLNVVGSSPTLGDSLFCFLLPCAAALFFAILFCCLLDCDSISLSLTTGWDRLQEHTGPDLAIFRSCQRTAALLWPAHTIQLRRRRALCSGVQTKCCAFSNGYRAVLRALIEESKD